MTEFDHSKSYSTVIGPGARGKYKQGNCYFDRNFQPVSAEAPPATEMPAVVLPAAVFKAEPVPRSEGAAVEPVTIVQEEKRGPGRPRKQIGV